MILTTIFSKKKKKTKNNDYNYYINKYPVVRN